MTQLFSWWNLICPASWQLCEDECKPDRKRDTVTVDPATRALLGTFPSDISAASGDSAHGPSAQGALLKLQGSPSGDPRHEEPPPSQAVASTVMAGLKRVAGDILAHLQDISVEYSYEDLTKATQDFDRKRLLGAGAAGMVYRGVLSGGTKVAVKVVIDHSDRNVDLGFEDEVRVLSRFRHPNVVTLFGWGHKGNEKYLVYEFLNGGDVQGRLEKCKAEDGMSFLWAQRLSVATDAARGLLHMVNSDPPCFHRDIKPANILLDSNGAAKIADFGLATPVAQTTQKSTGSSPPRRSFSVKHISGTPGYACPVYCISGCVNEQSEVYSFGIVLMELLLNQPPCLAGPAGDLIYPILQVVQPSAPGAHARLIANLDPKARWPPLLADDLADMALSCLDNAPARRPSYDTIYTVLQRLQQEHATL
eukprot:TRINITY_DN49455_c0_g1_i1.p1 TRINITY_DN49455_c0_g1~~TRINITY_DN49455_c0_g1_i1.p1  ORF type:complete len:421 (-),score=78.75 TRINITY_DN49455_c0_g1_i1:255-1517(-)